MSLPRWATGPFELLLHAEMHYRLGEDNDRRIALIGFDNAIEVSITAYLSMNPMHRGGRSYKGEDVARWVHNYHTKVDFFLGECTQRAVPMETDKAHIVWYHDIRNDQYHGGGPTIPAKEDLNGIRKVALWVFSVLFDVPDAENILQTRYAETSGTNNAPPKKRDDLDLAIDSEFGVIEVAGIQMYVSDVLYNYDPVAYVELGQELLSKAAAGVTP